MLRLILSCLCFLAASSLYAQGKTTILFHKMEKLFDQFNDHFDPTAVEDKLTLIYIPGTNDPFAKIYNKHKGKKVADNVQFIGGFKEMMKGWELDKKKGHLQDAFRFRYGKEHFPILLDLDSEIAELFAVKGYSIIQISKKENKVIEVKDFDFDRIAFFKALQQYFITP